jgi:hypothetical protein
VIHWSDRMSTGWEGGPLISLSDGCVMGEISVQRCERMSKHSIESKKLANWRDELA